MSLRVTQGLMYNSFISNMNHSLSAYMESNIQASSQKRVNRPSDDPVSAGRILDTRSTLSRLSTYEENSKMAMGWLALSDNILGSGDGSVLNVLSLIKAKDIQTSTGTINQDNRLQVASAIREYMGQLVALSNTKFGDQHIFAGHKTDRPPYNMALGVTVKDPAGDLDGVQFHVQGGTEKTVLITPVSSGPADSASYMYSADGGKTWLPTNPPTPNPAGTGCIIDTGIGVTVEISDASATVTHTYTAADLSSPDEILKTGEGTWLYVRPTAVYGGDDNTTQVTASYWNSAANRNLEADAQGHFTRDVAVRLDSIENGRLYYSFSTDNGSNWTHTSAPMPTTGTDKISLPVPGGYLSIGEMTSAGPPPTYTLPAAPADMGTQYIIHPHRADIDFQIGDSDYITVNMVGKDIFGGLYNYPENTGYPYAEPVPGPNMFETLGKLVAGLETNDQTMVQQCLDELKDIMTLVSTRVAEVGGRENRLIVTQAALVMRTYSEEDNLSQMEDVDVTELMTRLAQQQIAYNSVLKSSSMIMQMSLVNFL
ncbi:MAG: flagellar biosynthesis protein FlgL [Desulfovibrionaceae bacterium]|nr:flagellar biosynthesis protein FlgL [Desulfovibrionaceae bacterium]